MLLLLLLLDLEALRCISMLTEKPSGCHNN